MSHKAEHPTNPPPGEDKPKPVPQEDREERCHCGIEVKRARSLCTEADCFYK